MSAIVKLLWLTRRKKKNLSNDVTNHKNYWISLSVEQILNNIYIYTHIYNTGQNIGKPSVTSIHCSDLFLFYFCIEACCIQTGAKDYFLPYEKKSLKQSAPLKLMVHITETGYVCFYVVRANPTGWRGFGSRQILRSTNARCAGSTTVWMGYHWMKPEGHEYCSVVRYHGQPVFVPFFIVNSSQRLCRM